MQQLYRVGPKLYSLVHTLLLNVFSALKGTHFFIFSTIVFFAITLLLTSALWYQSASLQLTPEQPSRGTKPSYNSNHSIDDTANSHYNIQNKLKRTDNASEIRHIGFLKVRKAGGSTLQNIFFRFGLKRNLTFVLPRDRYYFNIAATLPVRPGAHYDILATHSWYKSKEYDRILPKDKVNIAIVREPIDRLISSAYYYRDVYGYTYLNKVPKATYIQELILHPEKYETSHFSETRNSMGQDFGFAATMKITDSDKIVAKLNSLEKEFILVLLTERFDESLVLMKRYLNWNLSDILYISRNTHAHQQVNITEELREKYKSTSFMDFAIYNRFAKIFNEKVIAEGPEFKQEVIFLQNVLNKTVSFCQHGIKQNKSFLEIQSSDWNNAFRIFESDCKLLLKEEITFIDELKARHKLMNGDKQH